MAAVHPSEYTHGASYVRNIRQQLNELRPPSEDLVMPATGPNMQDPPQEHKLGIEDKVERAYKECQAALQRLTPEFDTLASIATVVHVKSTLEDLGLHPVHDVKYKRFMTLLDRLIAQKLDSQTNVDFDPAQVSDRLEKLYASANVQEWANSVYLDRFFSPRLPSEDNPDITLTASPDRRPSCHGTDHDHYPGLRKRGKASFDDRIYYVETILFPKGPISEPLQYEDILPPFEMIPLLLRVNRDWLFDIYVRRNLGIAWRDTPPYHRQRYQEFRQTFFQASALKKTL